MEDTPKRIDEPSIDDVETDKNWGERNNTLRCHIRFYSTYLLYADVQMAVGPVISTAIKSLSPLSLQPPEYDSISDK